MEIGAFTRTYQTEDAEQMLIRMTADGIFHAQLNLVSAGMSTMPEEFTEDDAQRLTALFARYHVKIDALSGTFNMIDPDLPRRENGIRLMEQQCRIAKLLGAGMVTLCTGSKHPADKWMWHDDNLSPEAWDDLRRTTEAILPYAEKYGIVFGVEPEVNNVIDSAEKARRFLDEMDSSHLKIIMDGANLFHPETAGRMREVLGEAFDLLGDDIALAHAKDFALEESIRMCGPGEGCMDFAYYLQRLSECGYQGPVIMHGMGEESAASCRKYLTALMQRSPKMHSAE